MYKIQNGKPKLIAYSSKRLPEAERNYSSTELEMCGLAINSASFVHLLKKVDFDIFGTFRDYYTMLNNRLQYLHKLLQDFKSKRLFMINKDRSFFQYNSGDLVHIISPLTSQLCTTSRKVAIKYIGPVVIYKVSNPHNYLLMTLNGKNFKRIFLTWNIKTGQHKN